MKRPLGRILQRLGSCRSGCWYAVACRRHRRQRYRCRSGGRPGILSPPAGAALGTGRPVDPGHAFRRGSSDHRRSAAAAGQPAPLWRSCGPGRKKRPPPMKPAISSNPWRKRPWRLPRPRTTAFPPGPWSPPAPPAIPSAAARIFPIPQTIPWQCRICSSPSPPY